MQKENMVFFFFLHGKIEMKCYFEIKNKIKNLRKRLHYANALSSVCNIESEIWELYFKIISLTDRKLTDNDEKIISKFVKGCDLLIAQSILKSLYLRNMGYKRRIKFI